MRLLVSKIRSFHTLSEDAEYEPNRFLGTPPAFVKFLNPIYVHAQATLTNADILVETKVSTVISYNCARCLNDFDSSFTDSFQSLHSIDQESIDLTAEIKEAILVDTPIRALCRENCQGICATCGHNKNTEPCSCESK